MMRRLLAGFALLCACSSSSEVGSVDDASADTDLVDVAPREAEPFFPPPMDAGCPSLDDAGPSVETGAPMQAWCVAATSNASDCPSSEPSGGAECAHEGLSCRYALESTFARVSTCTKGKWLNGGVTCGSACTPLTGGSWSLASPAVCGSGPEIACPANDHFSDYERAAMRMRALVECCGGLNENRALVRFTDGCADSIELGRADSQATELARCLSRLLAGRRLACAPSACVVMEWSTVK